MTDRRPHSLSRCLALCASTALLVFALAVALPGVASAQRFYAKTIGGTGSTGGLFGTGNGGVGDVAVNYSSIDDGNGGAFDGWTYVVDRGNNRVQAFDSDHEWQWAIGADVVQPGGDGGSGIDEVQTVSLDPALVDGTFALGLTGAAPTTTSPLDLDASAAEVEAALGLLGSIGGAANIDVSGPDGGPWTVRFIGALADTNVNQLTLALTGATIAVGTELGCSTGTPADTWTNIAFQWLANGQPATGVGASTSTYTVDSADAGKAVQCQITLTNAAGVGATQVSNPASVVAVPSGAPPAAPSGAITTPSPQNPVAGTVLTCQTGTWQGVSTFSYQWYRNGVSLASANGAQTNAYTVQAADVSSPAVFQCAVTGSNASGAVTKVSGSRATGTPPGPPNPAAPGGHAQSPVVIAPPPGGAVTTTQQGSFAFERCTIASQCQVGQLGSLGGMLNVAAGIDVNQQTGDIFVRERNANARIQQFSPDGEWVRAFGWDVVEPGGTGESTTLFDELQRVAFSVSGLNFITGGTFALSYDGESTPPLGHTVSAAAVQAALEQLPGIGEGNVEVSGALAGQGGAFTVAFRGELAETDVEQLGLISALIGAGGPVSSSIETTLNGGSQPAFETCVVASECQAAATGELSGQFGSSTQAANGLAVAPPGTPDAGAVYAADPGNQRILQLYVGDPDEPVVVGAPIGSPAEFVTANWPRDIAADANGIIYGSLSSANNDNADASVLRFDTRSDAFDAPISPTEDDDFFDRGVITSLEIDQSRGYLVSARAPGTQGDGPAFDPGIAVLDLSDNPDEVDASHLVRVDAQGLGVYTTSSPSAIGVGDGLYLLPTSATAAGSGTGHRVLVLDEDGIQPPPDVTLEPVGAIGAHTATFSGHVDPVLSSVFQTFYRWQISKDGATWTDLTADEPAGTGGFTPGAGVTHVATGLDSNTEYRVRIRTQRNPAAGATFSAEVSFTTTAAQPEVATRPAQQVTDNSALLVGELNPGGLAATYWFEWGDTEFPNRVPVPATVADGGHYRLVGERLAGLEPDRVYLYRICASNALVGSGKVCAAARSLTTRSAPTSPVAARSYEMVLPPDKVLRRGGERSWRGLELDYGRLEPGMPSVDGSGFHSALFAGSTDAEAGNGFNGAQTYDIRRRQPGGVWTGNAVMNLAPLVINAGNANPSFHGQSADLRVQSFRVTPTIFESGNQPSTRVLGDQGGPRGGGWYPWLDSVWMSSGIAGLGNHWNKDVLIDDLGRRFVAQSDAAPQSGTFAWRNVIPADDTVSPDQLQPPQTSGRVLFLSGPELDWRPGDLVNECTGSASSATELPSRDGLVLGTRVCGSGSPTDIRGAVLGSNSNDRLGRTKAAAMSDDGRRIFFTSPDPAQAPSACTAADGAGTSCPPQLFVRQYADDGQPTVRWISRPADELFVDGSGEPQMHPDALGSGVAFEGASRDGRYVFFRTDAPLTADDPNGGVDPLLKASPHSWDLYRYDLGADNNVDPASGDPGDRLTRISGGRTVRATGDITVGSPTVSNILDEDDDETDFDVGQLVLGNGIPPGTTIIDVGPGQTLTLSEPAAATGTGVTIIGTSDPNTNCAAVPTAGPDAGAVCVGGLRGGSQSNAGESDGTPNGAGNTLRFLSDNGYYAYFVTAARLPTADNNPPVGSGTTNVPTADSEQINATTRNLYRYDAAESTYRFIARVPFVRPTGSSIVSDGCVASYGGDQATRNTVLSSDGIRILSRTANCVRGSASGDAIVFETAARLTDDDTDDAFDIYHYDAVTNRLTRLSAPLPDASAYVCRADDNLKKVFETCNGDLGFATDKTPNTSTGLVGNRHWNIAQDEQGRLTAVFFETRLPLLREDVNASDGEGNGGMDVYQWTRAGERLSLISPGQTGDSAFYTGNSRDGCNVFFWTEQRISPWEIDSADGDVYNATCRTDLRPAPVLPRPICSVLSGFCQGAEAQSVVAGSQTDAASAQGNSASSRAILSLDGLSMAARRKAARSGVIPLKVRTTAAGKLSLSARAKLGKRISQVARASKRVTRPGRTTVRLRLNSRARAALRRGRALRLSIQVRQAGARVRTLTVILKRGPKS